MYLVVRVPSILLPARLQIMIQRHLVLITTGAHGLSWTATAVAAYGGATYAAKCEMKELHNASPQHQMGDLVEGIEPLEPMPEPMCAA